MQALEPSTSPNEPSPSAAVPAQKKLGRSRYQNILGALGLLILGTLSALILFELAFRLLPEGKHTNPAADRPQKFYVPHNTPQKPVFSMLGAKAPGTFRIIAVGDSFTFGDGIQLEDAYPARLERLLNLDAEADLHAEVINAGVKGYSSTHELELIKRALQFAAPDLIILQMTLNDPELQPYRVQHPDVNIHGRTRLTSPVFAYWKSLGFVVERILNTQTHWRYVDYFFELFDNPEKWKRFSDSVRSARSLAAQAKVPLFVVVFPLFSHPFDERYPFQPQHDKIAHLLKEEKIKFLDLRKAYEGISPQRLETEPGQDNHPNEIAHRIAAERIYYALARRKLVPQAMRNKRALPKR